MDLRKIFENTDFFRSVNIAKEITKEGVKKSGRLVKALSCLSIPSGSMLAYACLKYDKITDKPFYEEFYCNPDSPKYILNR